MIQSPGALPLLSYTLSELYEAYKNSGREDRALKQEDYEKLGGVMGALRSKADALYEEELKYSFKIDENTLNSLRDDSFPNRFSKTHPTFRKTIHWQAGLLIRVEKGQSALCW